MRLYHFTAPLANHLGAALRDGHIETTLSKVDTHNRFLDGHGWCWTPSGPRVVWLTSNPNHTWRVSSLKALARITVETSAAVPWRQWSADHGIHPDFYALLDESGQAVNWHVVPRSVRTDEMVELRYLPPGATSPTVLERAALAAVLRGEDHIELPGDAGRYIARAAVRAGHTAFAKWLPIVAAHSSAVNEADSSEHGVEHWWRVLEAAARIATDTEDTDLVVVQLFALFHDAMRLGDGEDPGHGERGWTLAAELGAVRELAPAQAARLRDACLGHDRGGLSDDPTVGACWDADRLDLERVGLRPDPALMSTQAGRTRARTRLLEL